MNSIFDNILKIKSELPSTVQLVAVSKFKPAEAIMEAYNTGQRIFGENRPQELSAKAQILPKDIEWHFIGHLQSNKIKMVVPYSALIHSVASEKLLLEIDDYCRHHDCKSNVLLEFHIASEESKQGFSLDEALEMLDRVGGNITNVSIHGMMAMASFTQDRETLRKEFADFNHIFDTIASHHYPFLSHFKEKSIGMSQDYHLAIEYGATLVRIGTAIFGPR